MPAALLALCLVPLLAGVLRAVQLAGGPEVAVPDARFSADPLPVALHVVAATVFGFLGALQFLPGRRALRPRWHRLAGRVVVPAGLVVAVSGVWMVAGYPYAANGGPGLSTLRLVVATALAVFLVLGVVAILRGDVRAHRAWMIRAYALALGAGTQVLTLGLPAVLLGPPGPTANALLHGLGWGINLAVAEWAIRGSAPSTAAVPRRAVPTGTAA